MDRIWQWAWERHGSRFTWTVWAISCTFSLPIYLFVTLPIVAFERSTRYLEVIGVTACAVPLLVLMMPCLVVDRCA
jgi:adenylate cyclase